MDKLKKIEQLVDEAFDGGFDKFGRSLAIEKQVDEMLDKFDSPINGPKKGDKVNVKVSPTMQGGVDVRISETDEVEEGAMKDFIARVDAVKKKTKMTNLKAKKGWGTMAKGVKPNIKKEDKVEETSYLHKQKDQNKSVKKGKGLFAKLKNRMSHHPTYGAKREAIDIMIDILENGDYKTYFKAKLKDAGYDSPADIPDDKKKEFFKSVDHGWKSDEETEEQISIKGSASTNDSRSKLTYGGSGSIAGKSYRGGAGFIRGKSGYGGFGSIKGTNKTYKSALSRNEESNSEGKMRVDLDRLNKNKKSKRLPLGVAVAGGLYAGYIGKKTNKAICDNRFPTIKSRKENKEAYKKCLFNPFRKKAKNPMDVKKESFEKDIGDKARDSHKKMFPELHKQIEKVKKDCKVKYPKDPQQQYACVKMNMKFRNKKK